MLECELVDLSDDVAAASVIEVLNVYANDPMGGGEPLSDYARLNLIGELRKRSTAHVFLAYSSSPSPSSSSDYEHSAQDSNSEPEDESTEEVTSTARRSRVPVGLAICFEGFSTFECRPLLNIHDLVVVPTARRKGVCSSLLFFLEAHARSLGCCKLTLEVLEGNHPARAAYSAMGFGSYQLDPEAGVALFWQKKLD